MIRFLSLLSLWFIFGCSTPEKDPSPSVYKWEYESSLNESHFLIVDCANRQWFYAGTTDDLDLGREGYLPGFFLAEAHDIQYDGGQFRFDISLNPKDIFQEPRISPNGKIIDSTGEVWDYYLVDYTRSYTGNLYNDSILMDASDHLGPRVFKKVTN